MKVFFLFLFMTSLCVFAENKITNPFKLPQWGFYLLSSLKKEASKKFNGKNMDSKKYQEYGFFAEFPYNRFLNLGFTTSLSVNFVGREEPLKNYALAMDVFSKLGYDFSERFGFYGLLKAGFILTISGHAHVLPELPVYSNLDSTPFIAGGFLGSAFGFELFFNKWLGCFLELGLNQYFMSYSYFISFHHSPYDSYREGNEGRLHYFLRSYYMKFGVKTTL
jgi:hypothetical protein